MRLIRLSANQSSFKTINFNPQGLTLIVGASSKGEEEGNSNGVGKSLALRLVHHCLGANGSKQFGEKLPEWIFRLDFEINGIRHSTERSADSKIITLDNKPIKLRELTKWLDESGVFDLTAVANLPISFRALIKRFTRLEKSDCLEPDSTAKETPYEALVRTLFLLGLDISLVSRKHEFKKRIDALKNASQLWKINPALHDMFRAGDDARIRANWLKDKIPQLQEQLNGMVVAENYRDLEQEANRQTQVLRGISQEIELLKFQVKGISELLVEHPDVSSKELLALFKGLEGVFKVEALKHFEAVEQFHSGLAESRKRRLLGDLTRINTEIETKQFEQLKLEEHRDKLLQSLIGKTAFEEYRAVANQLAQQEQELKALNDYLDFDVNVNKETLSIKETMLHDTHQAVTYLENNPIADLESHYRALTQPLYPNAASGITFENNTGDNMMRYTFKPRLEGAGSDGIKDARLMCFDWLVFMHGANHTIRFLWHDNRLFAHLDPGVRARWFSLVLKELNATGKQYITTINAENYDSMIGRFSNEEKEIVESPNVKILELRGNQAGDKLLGIQVDLQ